MSQSMSIHKINAIFSAIISVGISGFAAVMGQAAYADHQDPQRVVLRHQSAIKADQDNCIKYKAQSRFNELILEKADLTQPILSATAISNCYNMAAKNPTENPDINYYGAIGLGIFAIGWAVSSVHQGRKAAAEPKDPALEM